MQMEQNLQVLMISFFVYLQFLVNMAAAKIVYGGVCSSGMYLSVSYED